MRTLQSPNRVRNGLVGVIILALVVMVGQAFAGLPQLFAKPRYYAEFTDAAGIQPGDKVRITGLDVGNVTSLAIKGDHVLIGFNMGDHVIGYDSRLSIRTDTILGKRVVEIEPRGNKIVYPEGVLPLSQSTTPYQLYDAFSDLTTTTSKWDLKTLKRSLNVLSETVNQASPNLSAALDGIARFSDTIGKRDQQFKDMLASANKVASVLGNRSQQVDRLLVNARVLLGALNERGKAIDYLLENVALVSEQFAGFVDDNPNLNHVLEQLRTVSDILVKHKQDLADTLVAGSKAATQLNETIASGPYFKVMVVNLVPYWILQPWVDAAFKKRGIDPEEFWRNAGLPAAKFPDPNGTGFANGAPPPAPVLQEGTPEHPGPAIPPGSPCSYTPPADGLPTPADPLPCSHLSQGPFGSVPGGFGAPDVSTSAPNPNGMPLNHGVPAAAVPGEIGPMVPGAPGPAPVEGPPGARTVPVPAAADIAPMDAGGN